MLPLPCLLTQRCGDQSAPRVLAVLIVVSNDKLLEIVPEGVPLQDAFSLADEILRQGITGISDIVVKPGLINVDFADVSARDGRAKRASQHLFSLARALSRVCRVCAPYSSDVLRPPRAPTAAARFVPSCPTRAPP